MILIITDANDVHADMVIEKLKKRNQNVFRFNLDVDSLMKTYLTYKNGIWYITQSGNTITNNNISSIWFRRAFVELLLEEKDIQDPDFLLWKNEWNKLLLGLYLSLSNIPTLCPLKQSYASENKFLQMEIAKNIGLFMPATITSNNKEELINFSKLYKENVVLKLHHQDFYKTENGYMGIYVNKVNSEMLLEFSDTNENPITLQEYIEKSYEVRYTVVGEEHFCCKIDSQKSNKASIDWRRYDIANTPHHAILPPESIKNMVDMLLKALNINYGALDFIVDKNDNWIFLEINPMGQWLWIEDLCGLKISDAICNWLTQNRLEVN